MTGFLIPATLFLAASVFLVPLAKRFGLGSVLGYLIAGIIIGPTLSQFADTTSLQHFAEFGVVMMLFLVGLELEPKALMAMSGRLFGLGGLQVGGSAAILAGAALFFGLPWQVSVAIGLVLALSSTAIVLQTLNEKGLMKSAGGQAGFSVLLFQDIAVIPMLALFPLLAMPELAGLGAETHAADAAAHGAGHGDDHGGDHGASFSLVAGLAGWQVALVNIGAIAAVALGGHYLSRPLFRFIAASHLREIFTAAALFLVLSIALLMTLVGLSPALGTFLAGVVLANSEFRHELESDIEPFKGLLLGLFFVTVGAGIDFEALFANFGPVIGLAVGMMAVKALVLFVIGVIFKLRMQDRWLLTLSLAQAGEFGFVLLSFARQQSIIPGATVDLLLMVVAISMLLTPPLFILFERVIAPRAGLAETRVPDDIHDHGPILIAGLGRFGQVVNRVLLNAGHRTTVLDVHADMIDGLRKFGVKAYYGDPSRPDLLHSAGVAEASLLVVAVDEKDKAVEIVSHARRERPDLHIIARAYDRNEVYRLYRAGANDIVREAFDSSVRASRYALEAIGTHPFEAEKLTTTFVEQDIAGLRKLAALWREDISNFDNDEYVEAAKAVNIQVEAAMSEGRDANFDRSSRGWLPPRPRAREPEE